MIVNDITIKQMAEALERALSFRHSTRITRGDPVICSCGWLRPTGIDDDDSRATYAALFEHLATVILIELGKRTCACCHGTGLVERASRSESSYGHDGWATADCAVLSKEPVLPEEQS